MAEGGVQNLNMVLLGKTGVGKSATGNTILGKESFSFRKSSRSTTGNIQMDTVTTDGINITVFDTPGVYHTELAESDIRRTCETLLHLLDSAQVVFLLVIAVSRFTQEDSQVVVKLQQLLGQRHLEHTWIIFTGGDVLEKDNQSVEEFISGTDHLKRVVETYNNRHHVFNNNNLNDRNQVKTLIEKVRKARRTAIPSLNIPMQRLRVSERTAVSSTVSVPQRFTPGDRVRVKASVSEPKYGWGCISAQSAGRVKDLCGEEVMVDFDEQNDWLGLVSEMELISSDRSEIPGFRVGDRVRVKASVREPKYGWGSVSHQSVGTVTDHKLVVSFPGQSSWLADPSEIEFVTTE